MKYFLSGILLALIMGIGASVLAFSVDTAQALDDDSSARNCTMSEVKACVEAGGSHPNSTCCPPKYQMEDPIGALDIDDSVAVDCSLSDVKLCYSGLPVRNSKCCPPKMMDNPIGALDVDDSVAVNCTFGDVKLCYSGLPVTNSKCCPPKFAMDNPVS